MADIIDVATRDFRSAVWLVCRCHCCAMPSKRMYYHRAGEGLYIA
jgi:hypothetical protein